MKQQEAQPLQEHRGASCYRHRAGAHGGLRDGLDPRLSWGRGDSDYHLSQDGPA
nr:hypothetical protein [uncultured Porphyromonas sp.]